jgi:hypothetical protein
MSAPAKERPKYTTIEVIEYTKGGATCTTRNMPGGGLDGHYFGGPDAGPRALAEAQSRAAWYADHGWRVPIVVKSEIAPRCPWGCGKLLTYEPGGCTAHISPCVPPSSPSGAR